MQEGEEWVCHSYVHPSLEVRKARNGRGVFVKAGRSVKKDEVLVVWTGRIVTREVMDSLQPQEPDYYLQIYDHLFQVPFAPGKREPAVHSPTPDSVTFSSCPLSPLEPMVKANSPPPSPLPLPPSFPPQHNTATHSLSHTLALLCCVE